MTLTPYHTPLLHILYSSLLQEWFSQRLEPVLVHAPLKTPEVLHISNKYSSSTALSLNIYSALTMLLALVCCMQSTTIHVDVRWMGHLQPVQITNDVDGALSEAVNSCLDGEGPSTIRRVTACLCMEDGKPVVTWRCTCCYHVYMGLICRHMHTAYTQLKLLPHVVDAYKPGGVPPIEDGLRDLVHSRFLRHEGAACAALFQCGGGGVVMLRTKIDVTRHKAPSGVGPINPASGRVEALQRANAARTISTALMSLVSDPYYDNNPEEVHKVFR